MLNLINNRFGNFKERHLSDTNLWKWQTSLLHNFCIFRTLSSTHDGAFWENISRIGSLPEIFLEKGVLKICSKFTGEYPCQSVISIKLQSNFIEITPRRGCSLLNLLHIFRTALLQNTCGGLLLLMTKSH